MRRECVGGDGKRQRGGKEAAREWRGRGAGVVVLRATGGVRVAEQRASSGGAELWRRRRRVRAAVQWSSGGVAAYGRRHGAQRLARKKEDVRLMSRARKETCKKVSLGPQTLKHRKVRWFM